MEIQFRKCKKCEDHLFGRSDKKFCSDKCKSAYNNEHNPKKKAFKSFCENDKEIRSGFKNLKMIIQTALVETKNRKQLKSESEDSIIEFELLKNYDLLSQIKKVEGLLNI